MKIKLIGLIAVMLLECVTVSAQQHCSIKGVLQDTIDMKSLGFATITVINPADSQIIGFSHANEKGVFSVNKLPAKKVRVLVTHPGYADYEEQVNLKPNEVADLGFIQMFSKVNLLREAIVKDKLEAIRIKGDTTEFLVDSFLTNKNSNVEDLLKHLPGVQVDKDGKITAMGKEVQKVLVDGEEFFGDDPTVATQNIKASQVESVQVFDKKSDQAAITGVDDGVKEKTINLKLKEDAKKGYFGKATAGFGTQDRYEHSAMFNRFKKKQKISAYGALSNTNKTQLSWEESNQFANDESGMETNESGDVYYFRNYEDDGYDGIGIPVTWYVGGHYSNKFSKDKHALNLNYSHKDMSVSGFDSNYTKYILPDTLYFNNEIKRINNNRSGDQFNAAYTLTLDTLQTIKLKLSGSQSYSNNLSEYVGSNSNELEQLVNQNVRSSSTTGQKLGFNLNLKYYKKFVKEGRSLSLGFTQNNNNKLYETILESYTQFYADLVLVNQDTVDQKKSNDNQFNSTSFSISYTEPLNKKFSLTTDYSFTTKRNKSALLTLGKDAAGNYTQQLDTFSNDFRYNININDGGVALRYKYKKITTSIGGRVSYTDLYQNNLVTAKDTSQRYFNLFPTARFGYKVGTTSNLEINYRGYTSQPNLQQIQPVVDNSNPLDLYVGNTKLVQSFTNSVGINYNNYKPISGRGMWSNANFSQTYDGFAQNDYVDSLGRRVHQTINVNGNQRLNAQVYYWFTVKSINLNVSNNVNFMLGKNVNRVNLIDNVNKNRNVGFGTELSKSTKDDKLYVSIGGDWNYNSTQSSIREDVASGFWTQEYKAEFSWTFYKKIEFTTDVFYLIRQRTTDNQANLNNVLINAGIESKLGKKENWLVALRLKDLLNQNVGYERSVNSNFVNENIHTVLQRYFMILVTYNINSANANHNEGGKDE